MVRTRHRSTRGRQRQTAIVPHLSFFLPRKLMKTHSAHAVVRQVYLSLSLRREALGHSSLHPASCSSADEPLQVSLEYSTRKQVFRGLCLSILGRLNSNIAILMLPAGPKGKALIKTMRLSGLIQPHSCRNGV